MKALTGYYHHHTEQLSPEIAQLYGQVAEQIGGIAVKKIAEAGDRFIITTRTEGIPYRRLHEATVKEGNVAVAVSFEENVSKDFYRRVALITDLRDTD